MKKFNDIKTRDDLSDFLKIPTSKLTYVLYKKKTSNLYTSFEIPKKNGGIRHIKAPLKDLKEIQKRLALSLWTHQKYIWKENGINPNISHAFQKEKSIITNAQIHRNKRFVLNIDLENFFDSFHFGRVKGFFEKNKHFLLPQGVATIIAQLTCYEGNLPQGAPSSPIITNLICNILDMKLLKISKKYKLNYTRYADDLTFSTNSKQFLVQQSDFHEEISKIIEKAGFKINEKKTRLQFRDSKQEVTGLIVNKKINVDRNYYKATRSMAHSLYTTGTFQIDGETGTINQLEGRFTFINQLDQYNNKINKSIDKTTKLGFHHLNSREKQYQKFLLYKY
ncbi:retron Ec67 family RNA-directed DNA polymerase/endonuclease, partial [Bacillus toyonensis]